MKLMDAYKTNALTRLNGRNLYYFFLAGAKNLLDHQAEINKINVFPVPDADTGTNLASTIRSIIDNVRPQRSYKATAESIAVAALNGARGNSGVIFAQFLYGLNAETSDCSEITVPHFAESVKKAIAYIYEAIAHPVEGTMLTVMREWAEFIEERKSKLHDFTHLLTESIEAAKHSLKETTRKLKVLATNNVVDAGAKGFVVFLEGILEFVRSRNFKQILSVGSNASNIEMEVHPAHENIQFRYCTEGLIRDVKLSHDAMRSLLESFGDSVVIAGSEKMMRIHVHTDRPARLFTDLRPYGTLTFQKADDMVLQQEVAYQRKYNIALVTDSTCDLPQPFIEEHQIQMVPVLIQVDGNNYLDRVTIDPEEFYKLSDETQSLPSTSQVNEQTFVNLYSYLASHYDAIISIHLSGYFSGTVKNAMTAAEKISRESGKEIVVMDSLTISSGMGLQVLEIIKAIAEGIPLHEIKTRMESLRHRSRVFVTVKTLRNLVRSGRVSPLKGKIASLLNIKPVISVDEEGKTFQFGKAVSQRRTMKKVMKEVKHIASQRKIRSYSIMHVRNPEGAGWFAKKMEKITGQKPVSVVNVTPAIALHAGMGAVALAVLTDNPS